MLIFWVLATHKKERDVHFTQYSRKECEFEQVKDVACLIARLIANQQFDQEVLDSKVH